MSDTTSIFDLPTNPAVGGNISLKATEQVSSPPLDQNTINQIVNDLQQASSTGVTQLPSRDIPMNTNNITQDTQIQPNYIPHIPQNDSIDYISQYTLPKINNNNDSNSLDDVYNELQLPLLIGILYFLFQLPFCNKMLYTYLPALFLKDGNLNLSGFLFKSILFGLLYYVLSKLINYF